MMRILRLVPANSPGRRSRPLSSGSMVLATALIWGMHTAADSQEVRRLTRETVLDVRVNPAEEHKFLLQLKSGESAEVVVQQNGIDVAVDVFEPSGKLLDSIDSPNGRNGPEPVSIIATQAGAYAIAVRPLGGNEPAGNVQVRVETFRDRAATRAFVHQRREIQQQIAAWLQPRSTGLPSAVIDAGVSLPAFDAMAAKARVIGLGEASHGSRELNDIRLSLVKRLVERHGYRMVALEDSASRWRDLGPYVAGMSSAPPSGAQLEWGWIGRRARNELLIWGRQWNLRHPDDRVAIVGVDGQDNGPARERFAAFVSEAYGAETARKWSASAADFAAADEQAAVFGDSGVSAATRQAAIELAAILELDKPLLVARLGAARTNQALADVRDLVQMADFNAGGSGLVSHTRDWYMAINTLAALGRESGQPKAIYWGHNAHVSTATRSWGPTGALLRRALGCGYQALATTFGEGSFVAQKPNDPADRLVVSSVGQPSEVSIEKVLSLTGTGPRFIWWGCGASQTDQPQWLKESRPMRWIGGLYDPATPPSGSYSTYKLIESFDGIVHFPIASAEDIGPERPMVPARRREADPK